MVAAAFPLAEVARQVAEDRAAATVKDGANAPGADPGVGDMPFGPRAGAASDPSGGSDVLAGLDGSSSRPGAAHASQGRAGASGSVLLDQVLGAAELMGHDVAVPELPTSRVAAREPLRAAILAWIAATGSVVPPDELNAQLARADRLPDPVQRDLALLILSTIEATTLQRAALAQLTPEELEWVYTHPEVAEDLARGVLTPETHFMASLAAKVDMAKSLSAALLLVKAVDATSGTLQANAARQQLQFLADLDLDPETRAMLALLAGAHERVDEADKVRLAAELVALGAGIPVPAPAPAPGFAEALTALLAATRAQPDAREMDAVLSRASALPLDLQGAVAGLLLAQARAVDAANPAYLTTTSQHEALVAMLVAIADALPTLQKYNLYWRGAPEALRASEWDPAMRAGWTAHTAGTAALAGGSLVDLGRASALAAGHRLPDEPTLPKRSFLAAYEAVALEAGIPLDDDARAQVADAAASLEPAVRDAAAILLSGAAESARLHRLAYADLSEDERRFLQLELEGLDALYEGAPTGEDLARLAKAQELAARVDTDALLASRLVVLRATEDAQKLLEGRDAYRTLGDAAPAKRSIWDALKRLLPVGSARAQGNVGTCPGLFIVDQCGEDVLLRVRYLPIFVGGGFECDEREQCFRYWDGRGYSTEMLVIYGTGSTTHTPEMVGRDTCQRVITRNEQNVITSIMYTNCVSEMVPRYGSPTIVLDLGGDDRYLGPVAMTHPNSTLPLAIHLDMGGNDQYRDPSSLYDSRTSLLRLVGDLAGHPTQSSAMFGGVTVLVDVNGNDVYDAPTRSQAFGRTGFALLADLDGIDSYTGRDYVQGAATETMTLGGAVLYDAAGTDTYTAATGLGYGLGALFVDGGGIDQYRVQSGARGVPVAQLDVIPGGDVTTFDRRGDERFWTDGPGSINVGVGVDSELSLNLGREDTDTDGYSDFVEVAVGTDPNDRASNPVTRPTARAALVLEDSDGDGWPDYLERIFSTDPEAGSGEHSYPAGLPSGLRIVVPGPVYENTHYLTDGTITNSDGTLSPTDAAGANETAPGFRGSDKIVDLRLPLQDAGHIEFACTGPVYLNQTTRGTPFGFFPGFGLAPGENVFSNAGPFGQGDGNGGPPRNADQSVRDTCLYVSMTPDGDGTGNGTLPRVPLGNTDVLNWGSQSFKYSMPRGILAIGDVVPTSYRDDYFVVIDLGGADRFTNTAGGGLVVRTDPVKKTDQTDAEVRQVHNYFVAPSLVVNVDVVVPGARVTNATADDQYRNASRDFAHGSYFGVLVDTTGSDVYEAGNVSQGSIGGVLLDLGGFVDTYRAGNLSQGAGLAGAPADSSRKRADLPANGGFPSDRVSGDDPNTRAASGALALPRRSLPGLLLDFGGADGGINRFTASSYSQGFATGFLAASNPLATNPNATRVHGILASISGADSYVAREGSRFMQGVGGTDGFGILFDYGKQDSYVASGLTSQGAVLSQFIGTSDPRPDDTRPHPAGGFLIDLGDAPGQIDSYRTSAPGKPLVARTDARNDATTIDRHESAVQPVSGTETRYYMNVGLHLDTTLDPAHPEEFVRGVGGGRAEDTSGDEAAFVVNLPSARLAIGSEQPTTYAKEYAFAVDLGGNNTYNYSAGGHIRDYLAARGRDAAFAGLAPGIRQTPLNLFPVTLLLDAGEGRSEYTLTGALGQGAGFFGVGLLADLGGQDRLVARGPQVPGLHSTWMNRTVTVDGTINPLEWGQVAPQNITLTATRDARFTSDWKVRVANDERAIYIALVGNTTTVGDDRRYDNITIAFDAGRRLMTWDDVGKRATVDYINVSLGASGCSLGEDRFYNATPRRYDRDSFFNDEKERFSYACRVSESGQVTLEIKKDLVETLPADLHDMPFCYLDGVGFGILRQAGGACAAPNHDLGVMIRHDDAGAGWYASNISGQAGIPRAAPFVWPAGATAREGDFEYTGNDSLEDELERWGVIGLAKNATVKPEAPVRHRVANLAQGAGLGGVGILAMLGTDASADVRAGDRSLGYGGFGGFGMVIDTGGSDRYQARDLALGAAESMGAALFLELDGHDNYLARDRALSYVRPSQTAPATSLFMDFGGDDQYGYRPATIQYVDLLRRDPDASGEVTVAPLPEFNNVAWVTGAGALGLDQEVTAQTRQNLDTVPVKSLYERTTTVLDVLEFDHDAAAKGEGKFGTPGCTDRRVASDTDTGRLIARGKVCFVAGITTSRGPAYDGEATEANITVENVDFLIDRQRVATTTNFTYVRSDFSVWSAVVDLGTATDGVARAKAMPLFRAEVPGRGAYLFSEGWSDQIEESPDRPYLKTILVNNEPKISLGVSPAFTGRADAIYSPSAYGAGQSLKALFAVSPDVAEAPYTASNEWRPAAWNTSFPCGVADPQSAPALCHILPFYLATGDSSKLRTEPGTDPAFSPSNRVDEKLGDPYEKSTDVLGSELRIHRDQSFHLSIPSRTPALPLVDLQTDIRIWLVDASGKIVQNATGEGRYYLGNFSPKVPPTGTAQTAQGLLDLAVKEARNRAGPVFQAVDDGLALAGEAARGPIVWNAINTTYDAAAGQAYGKALLKGDWSSTTISRWGFCTPARERGVVENNADMLYETADAALATAFADSQLPGLKGFRLCRDQKPVFDAAGEPTMPVSGDTLTPFIDFAEEQLPLVDEVIGTVAREGDGSTADTSLNFNDFFFDVNLADRPDSIRVEGDTVVIPKGYKIVLSFGYSTPSRLPINSPMDDVRAELRGILSEGQDEFNGTLEETNPPRKDQVRGLANDIVFGQTRSVTGTRTGFEGFDSVPVGFFFAKSGEPDQQPRLEIKIPAGATTRTRVQLENPLLPEEERVVATISDFAALTGDRPNQPTRDGLNYLYSREMGQQQPGHPGFVNWSVGKGLRWTQHEVQLEGSEELAGVYLLNVTAADASDLQNHTTKSVLIDPVPPASFVTTRAFAGKAYTSGQGLPVSWGVLEMGAGLRETYALYKIQKAGAEAPDLTSLANWDKLFPGTLRDAAGQDTTDARFGQAIPPSVRGRTLPVSDGDVVYVLTIAVDRASNVERSANAADLPTALLQAFDAKIGDGAWFKVVVDQQNPVPGFVEATGGRSINFEGTNFTFVRAGERIVFTLCVSDIGASGVETVNVRLDSFGATEETRTETIVAERRGTCPDGKERWVSDSWHEFNRNKTRFPSGVWQAEFEMIDAAGNAVTAPVGAFILDHESPMVRVEPPVLPPGQTAVKPGDQVKIRLIADDAFGVDESGIRVDASKFARNASALPTRAVRVNGVIYQEAAFVVDQPNLANGVYEVLVSVPDLAGGVTVVGVKIAVDAKVSAMVPGTLRATNVTHNSVVLRWETTENTSAFVKFGLTNLTMNGRTPQDLTPRREHEVLVSGLVAHTRYLMRAVSVSPAGHVVESDIIEVTTGTALFVEPISPVSGDRVSGLVPIKFRGGLIDSADFVTFTLEVREGASKPWTFVSTATRQGEVHELRWNSSRYLDGTTYELRLTAEAGEDRRSFTIGPLTSDNTPPSVLVVSPLLATNETRPAIIAEASDSLAGFGVDPVQLLIDGKPVEGNVSVDVRSDGRLRISHELLGDLAAGMRSFELRVADRAGNVARESWRVAIDGEAPAIHVNPTRYSPGTAAARNGGTVTLNLTILDLSGVSLVEADTATISSQATTRLVKLVNTDTWQGTFPVTAADPTGSRSVAIRATDLAGNTRVTSVTVPIDNVAPTLQATSIPEAPTHRKVVLELRANEPILVNGSATAPRSPAASAATTAAATTARLTFEGLLPSRTYSYRLTAVDLAGNSVDLQGTFATLEDRTPPTSIARLGVVDRLNGTLRLDWGAAADNVLVSHYRVYRSADGVTFQPVAEVGDTVYEDAGLAYEKTYVYKVAAVDFGGNEGPADEPLTVTVTAAPQIAAGEVTPTVGSASTLFRYTLTYTHPGGREPAYVRVILDGVPQNMTYVSGDILTGAIYAYETRLAPHTRDAPHTYSFEVSDGRYSVRFPEADEVSRGPLVSGDVLADGALEGFAAFAQRVPMGGAALMLVGLVAALGLAAALTRRNKKGGSK